MAWTAARCSTMPENGRLAVVQIDRVTVERGGRHPGFPLRRPDDRAVRIERHRQIDLDPLDRRSPVPGPRNDQGARSSARKRGVRHALGYMTQAPSVYEDLTAAANVRYFAATRGREVGSVLERVQLTPWTDQLVRNLSGGQLARVSRAAALVGNPQLLDEPTVGLDPLLRLFRNLASGGATRTGTEDLDQPTAYRRGAPDRYRHSY